MRTALLVAAFDSQLKWCARIQRELESRGFACRVVVPDLRAALSAQQIADAGVSSVETMAWDDVIVRSLEADVVVSGLSGPLTKRLSIELSALAPRLDGPGPVVVSGWVGIIIEKITAGYLDRCGTDVVAVNSAHDAAHFRDAARWLGLPDGNLLVSGLPLVSATPQPPRQGSIRRVLFADQPTVPTSQAERGYLYHQLIEYARAHPERSVRLKPRHRPGEDTFHRMKHHPEDLLRGIELPANFQIDYTPVDVALAEVDLLITMSSTACLEAIDRGSRVALVLDLGVHERYGNQVFLDSGLLRTFRQITDDRIGAPAPAWRDGYFHGAARTGTEVIADRVEELLASGERPSRAVWETDYFRGAVASHLATAAALVPRQSPLARRRLKHGPVKGTLSHVAYNGLPPVVRRPLKRWAEEHQLF
ncbi:DUF6716 putative glycosyltransferase [Streptomyces sp. SID8014]|uniref:DUF6716 putative glycosyltransferase n=1 Tax=Streptomyces sp. SID8014 TaxID=2706097 RepID=UPI001EF19E59|nr:DUF6716 putative glycosyltransferase [Streptomyces sp. SID8014]